MEGQVRNHQNFTEDKDPNREGKKVKKLQKKLLLLMSSFQKQQLDQESETS